jgi:putative aldouronate transport system permease protein
MNKSFTERIFNGLNYALILLGTLLVFYPFYYCVMLSFNNGRDAERGGIYFWPRVFTLENYQFVFSNDSILVAARNSVIRTVAGTILALLVTSMFAYAISKKDLLFRKAYMVLGLITMYFGGGLIPYFLLIKSLGLYNNFLVYIIPNLFAMFNALIFLSFFRTIPDSLEESAKLDGANDIFIYFKIIVPLSKAVFATIALFVGVGQWNSWFDTMLYASSKPELETLSHILTKMITAQRFIDEISSKRQMGVGVASSGMTTTALMLSTMVITAFPIIMLYPFLQKYFVAGIMIGSVKG